MWLRRRRRCMLGYEKLALQGFGRDDVVDGNCGVGESRRAMLAGGMCNLASIAEVMHAVFATIPLSET